MANFYADFPITGGSSGGSGTVTSVGLADGSTSPIYAITGSPVTTAGTLTFTLTTQTANTIFAGPATGAAAQPIFRALVAADLPAGGNLTDVGTDGIVITGGTGAVLGSGTSIAQHVADSTHNGYLSSTDWTTFNNKQSSLTLGNLTDVGTDGIVITGGSGSVVGSGTSIAQHVADSTHNGYLSSTDWTTFNNKQAALTIGNLTDVGTDGIVITGGAGAVLGSGTSIAQHVADSTHNGYLSSTDWTTFNGKGSGTVTSVAATVPSFLSIAGSPVTTTGTLAISYSGTALPVANGGTAVTSVTTAPAASSFAGWDTNKNLSANNFIPAFTTTATAAGTTVLTVASTRDQIFTGSTTQTVTLPVTSTLVQGFTFKVKNDSSGVVTVQSSGANTVQAMAAGTTCWFECVLTSGTTAASWTASYIAPSGGSTATPSVTGVVTSYNPIIKSAVNSVVNSTYSGTQTDGYSLMSMSRSSGGVSYNPNTATNNTGREVTVVKNGGAGYIAADSGLSGSVTTPEGVTSTVANQVITKCNTIGASYTLVCDGSTWYMKSVPYSYDSASGTWTFSGGTGGGTTSSTQISFTRHGNITTIHVTASGTATSGTANTVMTWNGTTPSWVFPGYDIVMPVQVSSATVGSIGFVKFSTAGALTLYYDATLGTTAWPSSVTSGFTNGLNFSFYGGFN